MIRCTKSLLLAGLFFWSQLAHDSLIGLDIQSLHDNLQLLLDGFGRLAECENILGQASYLAFHISQILLKCFNLVLKIGLAVQNASLDLEKLISHVEWWLSGCALSRGLPNSGSYDVGLICRPLAIRSWKSILLHPDNVHNIRIAIKLID